MADRNPEDRKPLIAIVTGGSPVDLSKVQELADAVLYVWYPGEEGGTAIADVLFGDVSPSGRLPITFPKSLDQLPAYDDYSMEGRTYKYMNGEPMYPFGFGLSYTQFEYSNATLDKTELSAEESVSLEVTVKNTGNVKSDEVVQVYISDLEASVRVPNSQFINTRRVTLEPGASEKVTFEIKPESFQVVQEDGSKIIEPGKFRLYVGGSSPMKRSEALGASKMAEVEFAVN